MNKIFLSGNLTRDVELRHGQSTDVARVGIAVNRRAKDEVDFFNLVAFGKTAEFLSKYFGRGSKVLIEGRLQTSTYEKDGVKRTATDIIIESVEFADSRKKSDSRDTPHDSRRDNRRDDSYGNGFDGVSVYDEDLPL